jgi:ketoreductase RED2
VNSSSSTEEGRALALELGDAVYVQADVADLRSVEQMIEAAGDHFGRLDHLVNNAGTTTVIPHHDFEAVTPEIWHRILDVNLLGTFFTSRAALPLLRQTHGSIVNITSIAGLRQVGSSVPYAVSKAALNHLTKLMANQAGPEVRINAVAPGLIETPWTEDWGDAHRRVGEQAPLRRSGIPEDVAIATVGLMVSPYATGQIVAVDGGMTLRS